MRHPTHPRKRTHIPSNRWGKIQPISGGNLGSNSFHVGPLKEHRRYKRPPLILYGPLGNKNSYTLPKKGEYPPPKKSSFPGGEFIFVGFVAEFNKKKKGYGCTSRIVITEIWQKIIPPPKPPAPAYVQFHLPRFMGASIRMYYSLTLDLTISRGSGGHINTSDPMYSTYKLLENANDFWEAQETSGREFPYDRNPEIYVGFDSASSPVTLSPEIGPGFKVENFFQNSCDSSKWVGGAVKSGVDYTWPPK